MRAVSAISRRLVTQALGNVGQDVTRLSLSCYVQALEYNYQDTYTGSLEEKEMAMRQAIRVLAMVCLMVVLSAGTALAASALISGTNAGERITGTNNAEEIRGLGGSDEIADGLDKDLVYGGRGGDNLIGTGGDTSVDRFYGGAGRDILQPRDIPAVKDYVSCGSGVDQVYADKADIISGNCEKVSIR